MVYGRSLSDEGLSPSWTLINGVRLKTVIGETGEERNLRGDGEGGGGLL